MNIFLLKISLLLFSSLVGAEQLLSDFSSDKICKAGIASINGRSAKNIRTLMSEDGYVQISYVRNDGRKYRYACLVQGNELKWKDWDGMSGWAVNTKIYFDVEKPGGKLTIYVVVLGSGARSRSFSKMDF